MLCFPTRPVRGFRKARTSIQYTSCYHLLAFDGPMWMRKKTRGPSTICQRGGRPIQRKEGRIDLLGLKRRRLDFLAGDVSSRLATLTVLVKKQVAPIQTWRQGLGEKKDKRFLLFLVSLILNFA